MSQDDEASGLVALSQWISNDAHFCEAKDSDSWRREHVTAIDSVKPYVKLAQSGRRTSSSPLSTSSSGTSILTASDRSGIRPVGFRHSAENFAHHQISNNGNATGSRRDHSQGVDELLPGFLYLAALHGCPTVNVTQI
jgi:hypothetical protein